MRSGACAAALLAGTGSILSPAAAAAQQPQGNSVIGPPQLRDFQIEPRERIVTQPRPAPTPQNQPAQPPAERREQPAQANPRAEGPRAAAPTPRPPVQASPSPREGAQPAERQAAPTPSPSPSGAAPTQIAPAPPADFSAASPPASDPVPAAPVAVPPAGGAPAALEGPPLWIYLLGGLALGLAAYGFIARRRAAERRALALPAPARVASEPKAPSAPRPDPVPRPWLEVELVPERATADAEESVVEFELAVRNKGGSPARNVQLQAKLICSTPEQDKEITAFQRKRPGEHKTLDIPDIPAGEELRLKGRVDIKRDDIKALRVDQRLLFIPLVAVNAFYQWGTARVGQTSKSFLVGREKTDDADKMAPFRLDLGPRVYRTVGQRPYKVERRV